MPKTVAFHTPRSQQRGYSPRFVLATLSILLGMGLSACSKNNDGFPNGPGQAQTAEVGVKTIAPQRIVLTTELSGRLSALKVSDVRPQISGIIQKRLFVEGSDVTKGQALYQIDAASYQATYDQAVGTLEKSKATLASAKTKADRYAELIKISAISGQDYDDAMAAVREDQASVIADQASLESARVDLQRTTIKAPIAGRIGSSSVTEGALVTSDQTTAMATIKVFDQMYLDVTRSSAQWLKLRKEFEAGQLKKAGEQSVKVQLVLEDGSEYARTGVLQFSGITVDATTGTVTLRSIFPNPDGALLPGMYVRARLEEGVNDNAILVPQAAVSRASDGQASVLVVDASNTVQKVNIKADDPYNDQWIVTTGLKAGDRVIVSGLQRARAGAKVKIADSSTEKSGTTNNVKP